MRKSEKVSIDSGGGPVFLGKVANRGTITGRSDNFQTGMNAYEAGRLFESIWSAIEAHLKLSNEDKSDIKTEVEEIRAELGKKESADEGFLMRRLRNVGRMAPDILDVVLAVIANPAAGFGVVGVKIAKKIKEAAG